MPGCSVKQCKNWNGNTRNLNIKFFPFPKNEELRKKWEIACGQTINNLKDARICSKHFAPTAFRDTSYLDVLGKPVLKLEDNAVPTLNLIVENERNIHQNQKAIAAPKSNLPRQPLKCLLLDNVAVNHNKGPVENRVASGSIPLKRHMIDDYENNDIDPFERVVLTKRPLCKMRKEPNVLSCKNNKENIISSDSELELLPKCDSDTSLFWNLNQDISQSIHAIDDESNSNSQNQVFPSSNDFLYSIHGENLERVEVNDTLSNLIFEHEQLPAESSSTDFENIIECGDVQSANSSENLKWKNLELRVKELELKNAQLSAEIQQQKKSSEFKLKEKIHEILSPVFTPGQIKKLLHPNQKIVHWSHEDIAFAIALRSVSPKAYRYLRSKNHPYPALSTLRKRASKVNINEGIIEATLSAMKTKSKSMSSMEKICVLSFDELYISQNIEIERKDEKRIGPHKTVQVGMARGLFCKWKQPIYYAFDTPLSKSITDSVIEKLYEAGFTVVVLTTDLAPSNIALWNELNVGVKPDQSFYIPHPSDESLQVFVCADVPHLLKLIRNNFIDNGFHINGKFIDKTCLEKLVSINKRDYKIVHKMESKHLDARGPERQKVSLAAQVFSNTTAQAIRFCGMNGYLDDGEKKCEDFEEVAGLLELVDKWFDIMNSSRKYESKKKCRAYGLDLDYQDSVLDDMTLLMQNMTVGTHKTLLPFQKGVIVTNNSLRNLLQYLQDKYAESFNVSYILTRRLNQDILENFFSYIRAMGGPHDKPSALQFKYRLRWYILGKHSLDILIEKCNTEHDEDTSLVDIENFESEELFGDNVSQTERRAMNDIIGPLYDHEMEIGMVKNSNEVDNDFQESGTHCFGNIQN